MSRSEKTSEVDGFDGTGVRVEIYDNPLADGYAIKVTANPHWFPNQSAELDVAAARVLAQQLADLVLEAELMNLEADSDADPAARRAAWDALTDLRNSKAQ
jgi:hypothetical protein